VKWKKRATDSIPIVPNDVAERKRAIELSSKELAQLGEHVDRVDRLAETLTNQNLGNHYIERLKLSYGR